MRKTKIVYAVEMLHYLPLFMAHERYLSDRFDIELAPAPHGDKAAIERLMSDLDAHRDVNFCVCDPMMVKLNDAYSADSGDWPVVIGQLIQRVPFWAVDHGAAAFTDERRFRQFDKIYAYPEPNTGYVFGKIVDDICIANREVSALATKAIDEDLDNCLAQARSVVIEADILKIKKYQESYSNHNVVFSYPLDKKYRRFCFTAIITRKKILETPDGLESARELLHSIQRAVYLIYSEHDIASTYANRKFNSFTLQTVEGALRQLTGQKVFSKSLIVDFRSWQKSIFVQKKVDRNFKYPAYRKFVNNRIARRQYRRFLKEAAEGSSYFLLRNLADYVSANTVLWVVLSVSLLLYAGILVALTRPTAFLERPTQIWLTLHGAFTLLALSAFYLRGWIVTKLNLDPANWLEKSFGIFVAYAGGEVAIIIELLKIISAHVEK
jgi:hypothetical protein